MVDAHAAIQAGKMVIVRRSAAQGERTKHHIVYLPAFIPQPSVDREIDQLAFVITDQHSGIAEIDGRNQTTHDVLHGLQPTVDFPDFRFAFWLDH